MLLTVRWGQLKPSQPSRRVARWGQIRPSQRHPAASQVGPLQAALPGPNQVVTANLAFVAARARRNTWLAVASDLKIFFGVVAKEPAQVSASDAVAFLAIQ